ncbi:membrane protein [Roseibium aquae]|uniref:Membrane protein n=1 Tax=Roseibium aquae TaxID=1323746 RepID=A0A916TP42_9HYPH|nr:SDR family oxidoreductase [Roseibium aquae]GGB64018.1 membrane protein [Roseibium aquae]
MTEKILITGAAGYLGSILVPELLKNGYQVTAVDTFARNDTALAAVCDNKNFQPVKGDARDEALMKQLLRDADIIIPLAALVGAPLCKADPINAKTTNFGAVDLLASNLSSDQRIIYPTTNSGYGIGEQGKFCTEETPLNPISLYGVTKCDAEKAVLEKCGGVTLRLATVFGMAPRMRVDLLVNDFTYRAVTDRTVVIFEGHFKRNYIHVRDVTKAFMHSIANYDRMRNNAYNVGLSDANLSKIELCEQIKQVIPDFIYLVAEIGEDPDKRDYIVSNDKIEATGWSPDHSIDDGIRELVRGYQMIRNVKFSNV